MTIHSLFILSKAGICLYNRIYSEEFNFEANLLTPFFSAIISFSNKLVERNLEVLEMSGLRFVFEIQDTFILVLLANTSDSILFISSRLKRINDIFSQFYNQLEDDFKDSMEINNPKIDTQIDSIITGEEDFLKSSNFYLKIVDFFINLPIQNEILGAAFLSVKGDLFYTSLPSEILSGSVKELEIRFITGVLHLPELYYCLKNGERVFSKIIEHKNNLSYFLVLHFDKDFPMGLARVNLVRTSKQIETLISNITQ